MRCIRAILLSGALAAFFAGSVAAQRGGHAGGGFGAGVSAGFHGGSFGSFASHGFSAPSGTPFRGSSWNQYRGQPGFLRPPPARFAPFYRPGSSEFYRRPYPGAGRRRYRGPYLYGYNGYLVPGYGLPLDYGLPFDYALYDQDDQGAPVQAVYQPESSQQDLPPEPGQMSNSGYRPEYAGEAAGPPVQDQPATTLIFNDGRAEEKVHNYVLTGTTLYALDGDVRKEIPLSELNLPATVQANRSAGVDFALPTGSR